MEKIIFECETITPMFCYGADQKTPEVRAASIKGALRFWWRAINGHLSINELRKKETDIFGGSGFSYKDDNGKKIEVPARKSKITVRINQQNIEEADFKSIKMETTKVKYGQKEVNVNIDKYLGLGMFKMGKNPSHKFIKPESKFQIIIKFPEQKKIDILNSFLCLDFIGNIGAKSRNGFGSIKLSNIQEFHEYSNFEDFIKYLSKKNTELPKYFAFSNKVKIFRGNNASSWEAALSQIGKAYIQSRITIDGPHNFEKRKYIAFPINARNEKIDHFLDEKDSRKPKPYFFKIIKSKNEYCPYIFYFPSEYAFGITSIKKYKNIDESKHTKLFLEACNSLNNQICKQGFEEIIYE